VRESNELCLFLSSGDPILAGSGIIIPRAHKPDVFTLSAEELAATFRLLAATKARLDRELAPAGYNVGWNCGAIAGQEVFHVHLHVIPRFADEPLAGKGIRFWLKQEANRRLPASATARPVLVRPATESDLDELGRMGAELARIHHAFDRERFMYGDDFSTGYRRWFARELPRDDVFLRVVDGDRGLDAYAYARLEDKDWNALLDEHAALHDIFVEPRARKGGLGAALLRAFCQWADERGAARAVLTAATPNIAAHQLFAKHGFRSTMIEMTRERGANGSAGRRPGRPD
jgi:diadenosine tetraphosphate (Ap4A) HIT family hydrolase/GNAT superfamily N-acetyltransferase